MFFARAAALIVLAASSIGAAPLSQAETAIERRFTPEGDSDNINTCTDLELVWFRSGYEAQNRLGLLGDPLYAEILKFVPNASARNVRFDTDLKEEFVTNYAGAKDAEEWVNKRSEQCPEQRYFIAGYSKGTLPLHLTRPASAARERIVASLVIGDFLARNGYFPPTLSNSSWPSNGDYSIRSLCNFDDQICYPGGKNHEIHLFQAYLPQLPAQVQWMLQLYQRNLASPFKYEWTPANN